ESITFPLPDIPSIPARIGIFRESNVACPGFAVVVGPVEGLKNFSRRLDKLESPAVRIHGSRISQRITTAHRVISQCRNNGSRTLTRFIRIEYFLACGGHIGKFI